MPEESPPGSTTKRILVESTTRLSLKTRILERLLGLFGRPGETRRLQGEILDTALEAVPCEAATFFLRNRKGELTAAAARGPVADKVRSLKLRPGEGLAGACLEDARPISVSDVSRDGRHAADVARRLGFEVRSILAVPVVSHGRCVGVIELINKRGSDEFRRHEIELLERIARSAGDMLRRSGGGKR